MASIHRHHIHPRDRFIEDGFYDDGFYNNGFDCPYNKPHDWRGYCTN